MSGIKKHISILAAAVLFICQIPCIASAETAAAARAKEITVFNRLGVLNIDTEEGYDENAAVTRAKFADMTAKAICAAPSENVRYFADVPADYWAAGSINALFEAGVISPSADKKFNPDSPVTYEQVCKIIVCAAGYGNFAAFEGEPMSAYVKTAENMGVSAKVSDRTAVSMAEAAELLYKGMSANAVLPSGVNKGSVDDEKTLFSIYHGVYTKKGVVTAVYGANLRDSAEVKKGGVRIDDTEMSLFDGSSMDEMFGKYVEYVYREETDGTYTLLYAEPVKSRSDELVISADLIHSFDAANFRLRYYKTEEKSSTAYRDIEKGIQVVYNGKPFGGNLADVMKDFAEGKMRGSVRLLSSGDGADCNLMIIKSYSVFIAGNYDGYNNILYSIDASRTINLDNYDILIIRDVYGNESQLPSDMPSVFNVAESEDGRYAEFIVCRGKKEGRLDKFDLEEETAVIGGETVKVGKNAIDDFALLNIGADVTAVPDSFGYIVRVQAGGEDMRVVYAMKVKSRDEYDSKFCMTVYEQDKAFHLYDIADRVTVDGTGYRLPEGYKKFFAAFPGEIEVSNTDDYIKVNFTRQILRIKLNSRGEISEIDTYNLADGEDEKNTLTRLHDGSEELIYSWNLKRFGMDTLYNSSQTKLFVVPSANADGEILINGEPCEETADMYNTAHTFEHDWYYAIESYNYNENNKYTDVIVLKQKPINDYDTVFMYDKCVAALDEDNLPVKQIMGYAGGNTVKFPVDRTAESKLAGLTRGDILRVVTNSAETSVCDIIKMFDVRTMTFNNDGVNSNWYSGLGKGDSSAWQWNYRNAKFQLAKGYALETNGGVIKITYNGVDLPYGVFDEAVDGGSTKYTIYDENESEKNRIRSGDISDVRSYKLTGKNCSTVLLNLRSGALKQIFVYQKALGR